MWRAADYPAAAAPPAAVRVAPCRSGTPLWPLCLCGSFFVFKMKFVGGTLVVIAIIYFAAGLFPFTQKSMPGWYGIGSICAQLIAGALYLALGIFAIRAAKSFRMIVETKGSDIRYLMDALTFLLKNYRIQYWVIVVAVILLVIALGAVFVMHARLA